MSFLNQMVVAGGGGILGIPAKVLIVAGGGGAGGKYYGGGGAGGLLEGDLVINSGKIHQIQVGAGGLTGSNESQFDGNPYSANQGGESGSNSKFGPIAGGVSPAEARGGGHSTSGSGGSGGAATRNISTPSGSYNTSVGTGSNLSLETLGLTFYGNNGGQSLQVGPATVQGGGGGGAGAVGANSSSNKGGAGGIGRVISWLPTAAATNLGVGEVSGSNVYFAGGGGGCSNSGIGNTGGLGGGGDSQSVSFIANHPESTNHLDATPHTGGGGAGMGVGQNTVFGGDGGTGVVVIRLPIFYNNLSTHFTNTSGLEAVSYQTGDYTYIAFKCTSFGGPTTNSTDANAGLGAGVTGTGTWTPVF